MLRIAWKVGVADFMKPRGSGERIGEGEKPNSTIPVFCRIECFSGGGDLRRRGFMVVRFVRPMREKHKTSRRLRSSLFGLSV